VLTPAEQATICEPNLTEEIYAGMVGQLSPVMRSSQGFIAHTGGPNPGGGWRVVATCRRTSSRTARGKRQSGVDEAASSI
jgi:hypothetical protein